MNPFKSSPNIQSQQEKQLDPNQLNLEEIELIMKLLGDTMFPVKHIEILYKAMWKLQNQHQNLKK